MRHTTALFGAALLGAVAFAWGSTAHAQEAGYFQREVPAPTNALELKVGTHYTQGFGNIRPGRRVLAVAGAGMGVAVDADWRLDPRLSLGLQGEYQEFTNELNTAARGFAGNVGVTIHGEPWMRGDPWVRLGTGYRMLWSVNPPGEPTTMLHGFELAKATLGYDVRVSPDIALAPIVGADLDLFAWQMQTGVNTAYSSPQVGTFIFAGLQGRFDLGGQQTVPVVANVR